VRQKTRKTKGMSAKKKASTATFQKKSHPTSTRNSGLPSTRSTPPSSVPAGHRNLQKYGSPRPARPNQSIGSNSVRSRITYFKDVNQRGSRTRLDRGIESASCSSPKGHNQPQKSRPTAAPPAIINPAT
jgi:hypothetical protein